MQIVRAYSILSVRIPILFGSDVVMFPYTSDSDFDLRSLGPWVQSKYINAWCLCVFSHWTFSGILNLPSVMQAIRSWASSTVMGPIFSGFFIRCTYHAPKGAAHLSISPFHPFLCRCAVSSAFDVRKYFTAYTVFISKHFCRLPSWKPFLAFPWTRRLQVINESLPFIFSSRLRLLVCHLFEWRNKTIAPNRILRTVHRHRLYKKLQHGETHRYATGYRLLKWATNLSTPE